MDATIPPAEAEMKKLGKTYEPHLYEGAGHGFLRGQEARDAANLKGTKQAWPRTVAFLRDHLRERGPPVILRSEATKNLLRLEKTTDPSLHSG